MRSYWKGASSLDELLKVSAEVEKAAWTLQSKSGARGGALAACVKLDAPHAGRLVLAACVVAAGVAAHCIRQRGGAASEQPP